MRKSRKQRENKNSQQLELFDRLRGRPVESPSGGTGEGMTAGDELLSQLERDRALSSNILERIVAYGNLNRACQRVIQNGGSSGVDGMDREGFRQWYGENFQEIGGALHREEYEVSPVLKVEIPKPTGGKRVLGIPTLRDRFIQQAIHQELSKYYEPHFSDSSYGFRPERSAHQAIEQAPEYIKEGREWLVDIDLEKFFDRINHERLMQRLSKRIGDKSLECGDILARLVEYVKEGSCWSGNEHKMVFADRT